MKRRRWLRWGIRIGFAALLLLGGTGAFFLRPAALEARLQRTFERHGLSVEALDRIVLTPGLDLEIHGLQVSGLDALSDRSDGRERTRLDIARARIECSLGALLLGRFRPLAIDIDQAALQVLRPDQSDPMRPGWSRRASFLESGLRARDLPELNVRNADIRLLQASADGPTRLVRRWVVNLNGWRAADGGDRHGTNEAYHLLMTQVGGSVIAARGEPRTPMPLLEMTWRPNAFEAQSGWIAVNLIERLLPPAVRAVLSDLALRGLVRLPRVRTYNGAIEALELQVEDGAAALPIEAPPDALPPAERFAQLTDVRGRITFESPRAPEKRGASASPPVAAKPSIAVDLEALLNGAPLVCRMNAEGVSRRTAARALARPDDPRAGTADWLDLGRLTSERLAVHLEARDLELPTAEHLARFVNSPRLPGPVRNFFEKYDPRGRVHLTLDAVRDPENGNGPGDLRVEGVFEALGAQCRYAHFPYPVRDVTGRVRFGRQGIELLGLEGRHGSARLRADGRLYSTDSWTGFDLRIQARNAPLDRDLYHALPQRYRALWNEAEPIGVADVVTTIHRDRGTAETGPLSPSVRVEARMLDGSLTVQKRRMTHLDGHLRIAAGTLSLENLHGQVGDAELRLDGAIHLGDDGRPETYDVAVRATGARLNETETVRDARGEVLGRIGLRGRAEVVGRVYRQGAGEQTDYAVRLTNGELVGFDPNQPWTVTQGLFRVRNGHRHIVEITAEQPGGRVVLRGDLPTEGLAGSGVRLEASAEHADMDRLIRQLIPPAWPQVREGLGFAGRCSLTGGARRPVGAQTTAVPVAEIQLRAERMKPQLLPLDLGDSAGNLSLRAGGFVLHDASARCGAQGRLRMQGTASWDDAATHSELTIEAQDFEIDKSFIAALPDPLGRLLERLAARGRLSLSLERLRLRRAAGHVPGNGEGNEWFAQGALRLHAASLQFGVPLEEFDGELHGRCRIDPDGRTQVEADFAIDLGRLADREVRGLKGDLRFDTTDGRVRLEDIRGQLAGGEVIAQVSIDPESAAYETSLTLRDVSFDQMLRGVGRASPPANEPPRPGRLDGQIFVRGVGGDAAQRRGGGEVRVRGASLLASRVTTSLLEASRQADRPIDERIEHAEFRFAWRGTRLLFNHIDITSRNLRLVGRGTWDSATDAISMTLLGAHPEDAPRLLVISDLLELAGRELLQFQVEGTAADPHTTVTPLYSLTQPLRQLLEDMRGAR